VDECKPLVRGDLPRRGGGQRRRVELRLLRPRHRGQSPTPRVSTNHHSAPRARVLGCFQERNDNYSPTLSPKIARASAAPSVPASDCVLVVRRLTIESPRRQPPPRLCPTLTPTPARSSTVGVLLPAFFSFQTIPYPPNLLRERWTGVSPRVSPLPHDVAAVVAARPREPIMASLPSPHPAPRAGDVLGDVVAFSFRPNYSYPHLCTKASAASDETDVSAAAAQPLTPAPPDRRAAGVLLPAARQHGVHLPRERPPG
jgi:hypothetical protein